MGRLLKSVFRLKARVSKGTISALNALQLPSRSALIKEPRSHPKEETFKGSNLRALPCANP